MAEWRIDLAESFSLPMSPFSLHKFTYCHLNFLLFFQATAMMVIAYFYFEKYVVLMPCPLCVTQRIFTIGFGTLALIAALHNPAPHKQRIYSVLIGITAFLGALTSARHVYLQSLPEDQAPACGPTLPYLMEYFPMEDVLRAMFIGEGSCAEIKWQLLGLSIPGWTLGAFLIVVALCAWQVFRAAER